MIILIAVAQNWRDYSGDIYCHDFFKQFIQQCYPKNIQLGVF